MSISSLSASMRQRPAARPATMRTPHAPETIGVCAAALVAASPLIPVYGSPELWLRGAVPATLIGALIAAVTPRRHTLHSLGQCVLMLVSQGLIGPIITLPHTTVVHIVPTGRTVTQGLLSTLGSFKQLLALTPPIGSDNGLLMAVWTIALFTTFHAVSALTIGNRALGAALSAASIALAFAAASLLGTHHGWHPTAIGILLIVTELLISSRHMGLIDPTRWTSLILVLAISVTTAYCGTQCIGQSGSRFTLRDRYLPPLSSYAAVSPLSGMRAMIANHRDDPMVTVTGLPPDTPLRLAVMDRFDGTVWNLADTNAAGSGDFRRIHERLNGTAASPGTPFTATFTVHPDYREAWLPLAGQASSIHINQAEPADQPVAVYANASTSTAFVSEATSTAIASAGELRYVETGIIPDKPSAERIDAASGATTDGDQTVKPDGRTADAPETVGQFANSIAAGFTTDGATVRAAAAALQQRGWFSHGLDGEYPSPPGHGSYRLDRMLTDPIMVGDSEQYASLMALAARELGIPSRVVLGFISQGTGTDAGAGAGDTADTPTVFTGNDIAAWAEVNLDGLGWTPLNPTPNVSKIPDETTRAANDTSEPSIRQPPPPLDDPLREQRQFTGQTAIGGDNADVPAAPASSWHTAQRIATAVVLWGSPIWLALLLCLMLLAANALTLHSLRQRGTTRQRIANGWALACYLLTRSGIPITSAGTTRQRIRAVGKHRLAASGNLGQLFETLGRQADYAMYSGRPITEDQAHTYWAQINLLRKSLMPLLPRSQRWRIALRPIPHQLR